MEYFESIVDAVRMVFGSEATLGGIMVICGIILFITAIVLFSVSFQKNRKAREKLVEQLKKEEM